MSRTDHSWNTNTSCSLTRFLLLLPSTIWVLCLLIAYAHTETTPAINSSTGHKPTTFTGSAEGPPADKFVIAYQPAEQDTTTVEQCVRDFEPTPEDAGEVIDLLIEQETIQRDLPETNLTPDMCQEIRERAPEGSLVHKLVTAQNYVQEITLVDQAIRQVEGETGIETPPVESVPSDQSTPSEQEDGSQIAQYGSDEGTTALSGGSTTGEPGETTADDPDGSTREPPGSPASRGMTNVAAQAVDGEAVDGEASIEEAYSETKEAGEEAGLTSIEAAAGAKCVLEAKSLRGTLIEFEPGVYDIDPDNLGEEIEVDNRRTVELFLSPKTSELLESLDRELEEIDRVSETPRNCIRLSNRMKVTLEAPSFEVKPIGSSIQTIIRGEATNWDWHLTATKEGRDLLWLILEYENPPGSEKFDFRTELHTQPISIVSPPPPTFFQRASNFIGNYWQWLWAAILVPIAGWAWRKYRERHAESQGEE